MYKKRRGSYNLNTSDKAHTALMLKNLFTSLLLSGKIVTTSKRAKALKSYAQKLVAKYKAKKESWHPIVKKTWLKEHILTRKDFKKAVEHLEKLVDDFKVGVYRAGYREGDGALLYEVRILNFDKIKNVQQNNVDKK